MTLQLINTLLMGALFLIIYFGVIYPAGYLIVRKFNKLLKPVEVFGLSMAISIALFIGIAILFGILKIRFLVLPLVVGITLATYWKYGFPVIDSVFAVFKNKILFLLSVVAIIVQGIINFPSGYLYGNGYQFWSSQGNDGLWHVAVMEEIKKSMPIENPIYYGEKLYNYHYLTDVFMGEFARLFPSFTSLDLYFRYFPIVFSLLISIGAYAFVSRWSKSESAGYWAIFFSSLSGGFGYIVTLIKEGRLFAGETIFWAAQGNTIIGNPPHAVAYGLLAMFLLTVAIYLETRKKEILILAVLTGSFVAGFKVSGGFILSAGIIAGGLFDFLIHRKKEMVFIPVIVGLMNFITLKLMTKGADSFLVFEPWWFVRTTIVADGRVGIIDMELRRQHYLSLGTLKATLRVIELEVEAFLMFFVGNMSTRIIGFFLIFANGFKGVGKFFKDTMNIILITSALAGLGIVLLFVQKGIAYNLIQFFQYSILIMGFLSAAAMPIIIGKIKPKIFKIIFSLLIVLISIPTVIGNVVEFYGKGRSALALVSNSEIEALEYLRSTTQKDSVILTYPFDGNAHYGYKEQPWPISVWYSTAYVSALSSRRTYFSNEGQVDILGIPIKERREEVLAFFNDPEIDRKQYLNEKGIDYVYVLKKDFPKQLDLEIYYESRDVIIYWNI